MSANESLEHFEVIIQLSRKLDNANIYIFMPYVDVFKLMCRPIDGRAIGLVR